MKKLSRDIHTVVVLADEVARAEEAFVRKFNLSKGADADADVTSIPRQAIFDQDILPGLQVTLMISSLTLNPRNA